MIDTRISSDLPTLCELLCAEEQLIREAVATTNEIYAALRVGDCATMTAAQATLAQCASSLRCLEDERAGITGNLARALRLASNSVNLSVLIKRLPESDAGQLKSIQSRLAAAAAQFEKAQRRNANLIHHLRSYFRGVLSALTAAEGPSRYGPTGTHLVYSAAARLNNRG